jgi:hypothetical protein
MAMRTDIYLPVIFALPLTLAGAAPPRPQGPCERHGGKIRDLPPGCLTRPVPGGNVCKFVRDHAGDLGLVVGLEQESGADEDENRPAVQRR